MGLGDVSLDRRLKGSSSQTEEKLQDKEQALQTHCGGCIAGVAESLEFLEIDDPVSIADLFWRGICKKCRSIVICQNKWLIGGRIQGKWVEDR